LFLFVILKNEKRVSWRALHYSNLAKNKPTAQVKISVFLFIATQEFHSKRFLTTYLCCFRE